MNNDNNAQLKVATRNYSNMASSEIPKTMSGVVITQPGGVDVLAYKTDLPVPEIKEGEILVKNEYIGVNYIDTYVSPRLSSPFCFPPFPFVSL